MKRIPSLYAYLALLQALLLVSSACSEPAGDQAGRPRAALGVPGNRKEPRSEGKGPSRRTSRTEGPQRAADRPARKADAEAEPRDAGSGVTPEDRRGERPEQAGGRSPAAPQRVKRAVEADVVGDPEGSTQPPPYMDIKRVELGRGERAFVARLTFSAAIPRRMSDDQTTMLTGIEVDRGGDDLSIYAEGTVAGWRAHSSRSDTFPGEMTVKGSTLTLRVPRSFVGRSFHWYAHSSWTRSTLLETEYSFDFAPDDQRSRFPRRHR